LLIKSAIDDDGKALIYLLKTGANLDLQNFNLETALMLATRNKNFHAFATLLKFGANPFFRNLKVWYFFSFI